jgi:hypothetical protein
MKSDGLFMLTLLAVLVVMFSVWACDRPNCSEDNTIQAEAEIGPTNLPQVCTYVHHDQGIRLKCIGGYVFIHTWSNGTLVQWMTTSSHSHLTPAKCVCSALNQFSLSE